MSRTEAVQRSDAERTGAAASWAEVRARARQGEPDRYLAALLAPADVREDLVALSAAVADIGRIPGMVREPMMGEIRLQWWRDVLAEIGKGQSCGNPVADRLGGVIVRHGLPVSLLIGMTEARAFDLYPDPFPDAGAFAGYLAKTEGAAFSLALRVMGLSDSGAAGEAAVAAGQAYGRARLLVGLGAALAAGRLPLPADDAQRLGVAAQDLTAQPLAPPGRALVDGIAAEARRQFEALAAKFTALAPPARAALLPAALIEPYLRAFERQSAADLSAVIGISPLQRVWRLWRVNRTGRLAR